MRPVTLLLMFAACGGSGDGAVLSFTAPDGPVAASRIELVLASADTEAMTETKQRTAPGMLAEELVVYYRQRSTVDALQDVTGVDGFEVRIEPDQTVVGDETFVPFALFYNAQDALIAVGTVNDENGVPTPVIIKPGTVASYDVAVVTLAPDAEAAGIAAGQGHAVRCESNAGSWASGAVWKPATGPQIRLLLPDVAADPDATDAMERANDLDCDDHSADGRDCDDLRSAYHVGQTETCDGLDTDCDGRPLELITGCAAPTAGTCSAPGVQVCADGPNDATAGMTSQCLQSAACGCALVGGSYPVSCNRCALNWVPTSGGVDPCDPGVGKLHFDQCVAPGCTVEVVGVDGPWEVKIGPGEIGPFSARITGITGGYYYLRAKYLDSAPFATNTASLGGAYIAITGSQGGRPALIPINLEAIDGPLTQCPVTPSGNIAMQCSP